MLYVGEVVNAVAVNVQAAVLAIEWSHKCSASWSLCWLHQTLHWKCMYQHLWIWCHTQKGYGK